MPHSLLATRTASLAGLLLFAMAATPAADPLNSEDWGFESPVMAPGQFQYAPISSWSFSRYAGISANGSAFTLGNSPAPEGRQVAFLQNDGRIHRSIFLERSGYHAVDFSSAQRANMFSGPEKQTLRLWLDGEWLADHRPPTFGYSDAYYTFFASAGIHTIALAGTAVAGDQTAFVDRFVVAPRAWGFWDPGLVQGAVKSGYLTLDKGTVADPLTLPTPCLWAAGDPQLIPNITCAAHPAVYPSSFPFWQNTSWDADGPYWVFAINNEPAQDPCNLGPPNLSLPRSSPGSGIAGFVVMADAPAGEDFQRAHLVLNQRAAANPCPGGITYMSFGAQSNRGNGQPVVAINAVEAPSTIRFTAKLWAFEADSPSWFRFVLLSAWPDAAGRWVPRQVQLNLFTGGRDHVHRSHWNWPVQDDFFPHGGAEIVAIDADVVSELCGLEVPMLKTAGEEIIYTIEVDRVFRCLTDTHWFSDPLPQTPNIAVTGVHWAVENATPPTVERPGVIWVSVHGMKTF